MEKISEQMTSSTWTQPTQHDVRGPAAKDKNITQAGVKPSNLDAASTMRSAETELQSTMELGAKPFESAAQKPDLDASAEKKQL